MLAPADAVRRELGSCPLLPFTNAHFQMFESQDAKYPGRPAPKSVRAFDGSSCAPVTGSGIAQVAPGKCVDLGVSRSALSDRVEGALDAPSSPGMEYLPQRAALASGPPSRSFEQYAQRLQHRLQQQQFPPNGGGVRDGCGSVGAPPWRVLYYVDAVPQLGFGSTVEYGIMFLARATHLGSQLVFGRRSSPVWTSPWACGGERSLSCYFNMTGCCGVLQIGGRTLQLPRRRNPINLGLPGFETFGAAALSGQLAHFFFERMTPRTRAEVDKRREAVLPRRVGSPGAPPAQPACIGMHVRGGDACHARRYCPSNLTSTYFAEAARMRDLYGVNTIILATDSSRAAEACASRPLGFECRTLRMTRAKFESATFIEQRVSKHEAGKLSGSTIALDTLADVDMLADCQYHVLVFRSAISRLAYALATARRSGPTPVASMQNPFGSSYLKLAGGRRGGGAGRGKGGKRRAASLPPR
jgi:hypothetical protein